MGRLYILIPWRFCYLFFFHSLTGAKPFLSLCCSLFSSFHSQGGASVLFRFFHLLGGVKPFSFLVLVLIQFIFHSLGAQKPFLSLCCSLFSLFHSIGVVCVLFCFFPFARRRKALFLSCVAAYSVHIFIR